MHSARKMEKNLEVEKEECDTLGNDVGFLSSSFKTNEWENSVRLKSVLKLAELVPQSYCSPNSHYLWSVIIIWEMGCKSYVLKSQTLRIKHAKLPATHITELREVSLSDLSTLLSE